MGGSFLDSNVFVYLVDDRDPMKQAVAESLVLSAPQGRDAVISFQVVQETLNVITRRIAVPLSAADADEFFDRFLAPLWRVMPTAALYHRALEVQQRYGFHFYDALIVSAALEADCDTLLTEDLQDGQRIERLTVRNPFR